jgi:hypothetical protein
VRHLGEALILFGFILALAAGILMALWGLILLFQLGYGLALVVVLTGGFLFYLCWVLTSE